jgi:hypothetical protein
MCNRAMRVSGRWYALAGHVLYEYSASDDKNDTDIDYDNSTDNNSSSSSNSKKTSPAKQVDSFYGKVY